MKAAQALKISYRAAWGRLQASEERLGVKLVEKKIGRHDGKNTVLTEQGKQWLEKFNKLESALKKELETFEKQFQK
jgi:molybdate transport system regulatory protein